MLSFFFRFFLKECGNAGETHVVAREVGVQGVVDVRDVVFDVNLFIDGCFALGVVVDSGVGGVDGGFIDHGELALDGVKGLEDDASEFSLGVGGPGNQAGEVMMGRWFRGDRASGTGRAVDELKGNG